MGTTFLPRFLLLGQKQPNKAALNKENVSYLLSPPKSLRPVDSNCPLANQFAFPGPSKNRKKSDRHIYYIDTLSLKALRKYLVAIAHKRRSQFLPEEIFCSLQDVQ